MRCLRSADVSSFLVEFFSSQKCLIYKFQNRQKIADIGKLTFEAVYLEIRSFSVSSSYNRLKEN